MPRNKKVLIMLVLASMLLMQCSDKTPLPETSYTETDMVLSTPIQSTSPVLNPVATLPFINTSTPDISITVQPTSESSPSPSTEQLNIQCLNIDTSLPSDMILDGALVVRQDTEDGQFSIWNLSTNEYISPNLTNDPHPGDIAISPDGNWLAYFVFRAERTGEQYPWIIATSADGQEYMEIKGVGWSGVIRWLDNNHILVRGEPDLITPIIVLNPFTRESQTLLPDFPEIYDLAFLREWWSATETVYDPSLTRVVYPELSGLGANIVLMDLQNHSILARLTPVTFTVAVPVWSPDGQRFVYTNATRFIQPPDNVEGYEIFVISREGEISQITSLSLFYSDTLIPPIYSWSPDGRFVAFYLIAWQGQLLSSSWAVVDTISHQVTNYCIKPYSSTLRPPVWSQNGKQFVVEAADADDENHRLLILVDIERGLAALLAEGVIPYGWLTAP